MTCPRTHRARVRTVNVPAVAWPAGIGHARNGFTLFEVAISLVLLTFGVTSVLVLFPTGLKAQQMSRFQIYAAAKAEEMVEQFNCTHPDNATTDTEGCDMWEVADTYRAQAWDLEARLNSHRYGIMALPLPLASRLDSDNDEIQQILSQGGFIYYAQPMAASDVEEQAQAQAPPQELQRLIIGVTGYAQQNCMHMFPLKNWPYTIATPSPPLHSIHLYDAWLPPIVSTTGGGYSNIYQWPCNNTWNGAVSGPGRAGVGSINPTDPNAANPSSWIWPTPHEDWLYCWESAIIPGVAIPGTDPDIQKVFDWSEAATSTNLPFITGQITHYGYLPYAANPVGATGGQPFTSPLPFYDGTISQLSNSDACIRYVQSALWYCQQKTLQSSSLTPAFWTTLYPSNAIPSFAPGTPDKEKWMQVQAMRFLSHAATCLTGWFPITTPSPNPNNVPDLTTGVMIPTVVLDGKPGALAISITNDMIQCWHERAVHLANDFASNLPYDWAVPRPIERSIMTDYPLLQLDMFSAPLGGTIFGTGNFYSGVPAQNAFQWRPISPRPIKHIGLGQIYPVNQTPAYTGPTPNPMGGQDKLDGTIVPGKVSNLMGDLDHYTLGRPFDASERCREIVFWTVDWQSYEDFETLPSAPIDASKYPLAGPRMYESGNVTGCQVNMPSWGWGYYRKWEDRMWDVDFVDPHLFAFRNPEKTELFYDNVAITLPTGTNVSGHEILNGGNPDKGSGLSNRQVFSGMFGADRNFNQQIDSGPVPTSVRLRAVQVARFNFYDPRIPCLLR